MNAKFKSYNINNLSTIPFFNKLNETLLEEMKLVGDIYPFKTNDYVIENLINWEDFTDDPIFRLNFPHKEMLTTDTFDSLKHAKSVLDASDYNELVGNIRAGLNPHPAGQVTINVPLFEENRLEGIQHKYKNTLLFFPSHGQSCHAYCTFCFRWPQFVSNSALKFQAKEIEPVVEYLKANEFITDILITGGDPMIMNSRVLLSYIAPLLEVESLKTIRIGTKSLSFWPYKFTTDSDAEGILSVLRLITERKKHLAVMAHFNHTVELQSNAVVEAISKLKSVGAEIRTQAPLLKHINDSPEIWAAMWQRQIDLGCIPYYMFLARDTGAQHYFAVSLKRALEVYKNACIKLSGLGRTARGPIMSTLNGKVELLDEKNGVYLMRYLQHRNPDLTYEIFSGICKLKKDPIWFDELSYINKGEEKFFV